MKQKLEIFKVWKNGWDAVRTTKSKGVFTSTASNFSNCILKCLCSRSPRPDTIKGILNVMNWLILTTGSYTSFFIYLLSSYPHLLFLAFLQSFLEDKKGIKLGSKAIIFSLLFHEPQYNISICTLVFFKFLYVPQK